MTGIRGSEHGPVRAAEPQGWKPSLQTRSGHEAVIGIPTRTVQVIREASDAIERSVIR
jgi:hypothetical protein